MAEVLFTDAAVDDLRRLGPDVVPRVLKKIQILFDNPEAGHPLGGELTGFRKLVVGRNHWRIVYRITTDGSVEVCEVWCVGVRSDAEVYAEASARVASMADEGSTLARLADVIGRLGRLAGDVVVEETPPREPVPDWLAQRLVRTAGIPPVQVAALSLEQAVDLWTDFMSASRPSEPIGD
ncbi:type II toxin-antitoxin system RelE family toxin [Lentzea flaviverrucosa]|uniref:mRNA-degrading endonuclease RelE, toxin component of the RelBE toxin-antitoxin system n=1 Tax=Lentzea flaviverrucosa TaxID=200379 RepID=A0A1H9TIY1_9PSEU|nr:type II toxin-antitoxin system RelE/ParE family toxin [Lentzea flaviverrucosa]RDI33591.1 mRNA-degrading endonuclease RelE of RelBE toxin-antitoxin system [Lentzea flaviverrucosa]SER97121.1 mRNA-degrading endonuclease RelE, toxin component of the RelBE toxin-antitoxin system [Lentzea flaviverrucosa]